MKSKQILSIEQMQHLQELGLKLKETMLYWAKCVDNNPRAATHYGKWVLIKGNNAQTVGLMHWEFIPAYTLQDVLDALPKSLEIGKSKYEISIYMIGGKWAVDYYSETDADIQSLECESLIDAVYSRLCWCIENGYVETNKNE